jgi:hypothetical protein
MADGDPIIIGLANIASNPGTTTSLSRNEDTAETVFVARNLNKGNGIRGEASGSPGADSYGVVGHREGEGFGGGVLGSSNSRWGVEATSTSGFPALFVDAEFTDDSGEEVGSTGTYSQSFGSRGIGVWGVGGLIGVRGIGLDDSETRQIAGVVGEVRRGADNSPGVIGRSSRGPGVLGEAGPPSPHPGVRGISSFGVGVLGQGRRGVVGLGQNVGVFGQSFGDVGAFAGWFSGRVRVTGTFYKGGGGFLIDHPQHPEDKYLAHSFVESDDMKNVYDGETILDESGAASVDLPEWFEALNRDFRYQLTAVGGAAPNLHVAQEVSGNRFKIAGGEGGMKVCWQVTGIRQDRWASANRIEVEEEKAEGERGYYLHPDLYEQPEEQGIVFAAFPDEMREIKQLEEGQSPGVPSVLDDPRIEEHRQQIEELRRQFPPPSEE